MYANIHNPYPVARKPTQVVVDGLTIHNPTNDQLRSAGWRKLRNEVPTPETGLRIVSYVLTNDDGEFCDLGIVTEENPYAVERGEYLAAVAALNDAKVAANVNGAILALERMVKSLARVLNNEV